MQDWVTNPVDLNIDIGDLMRITITKLLQSVDYGSLKLKNFPWSHHRKPDVHIVAKNNPIATEHKTLRLRYEAKEFVLYIETLL